MVTQRWDPFRELERRMEEVMDRVWRGVPRGTDEGYLESWSIPLDVIQKGDDIVIEASLPGVRPEDIDVTIENDVLTINAKTPAPQEDDSIRYLMKERRTGTFHRTLRLPDTVDTEKAQSRFENGVLTVVFPKLEAKKAKRLAIKAG